MYKESQGTVYGPAAGLYHAVYRMKERFTTIDVAAQVEYLNRR